MNIEKPCELQGFPNFVVVIFGKMMYNDSDIGLHSLIGGLNIYGK